jgi:uncharacterized phage-associated protein
MHDSRAVANEMLAIAEAEGIQLTPMQLLKLVFFAHGWSVGLRDKPLIFHDAYAWQYGPVIREVYWAFSEFGRHPITSPAADKRGIPFTDRFSTDERKLMKAIVRSYGQMHAYKLSDLSHREGSPWSQTYKAGQRLRIKPAAIKSYYQGLARRQHESRLA